MQKARTNPKTHLFPVLVQSGSRVTEAVEHEAGAERRHEIDHRVSRRGRASSPHGSLDLFPHVHRHLLHLLVAGAYITKHNTEKETTKKTR